MAKVCTEHKERLIAMGKWPEFVLFRDEMKANGVKSAEANRLAVLKFLGEESASHAGEYRARSIPRRARISSPAAVVEDPVQVSSPVLPPSPAGQDSTAAAFVAPVVAGEGKEADILLKGISSSVLVWVARQLSGMPEVRNDPCPDPMAVTLLNLCKTSAMFQQNFLLNIVKFAKPGGDEEEKDAGEARVSETIDKLLSSLRGSSVAEEYRAHAPVVAGSTPAPATISGGV